MSGTASSIVLGLLLATAYGAAFHFFTGGSLKRLIIYIIAAWIGFTLGHFIGDMLDINWLHLGPLNLLSASVGSWFALFGSWWLAGQGT